RIPPRDRDAEAGSAGLLLAFAYPDRIAQKRPGQTGRYLLRNGRGAVLEGAQALAEAPFLVAAELDGQGRESRAYLAAPLAEEELAAHFAEQVETEETVAWDAESGAVRARRRERLGALTLRDAPLADPDPERVAAALAEGIARAGIASLPWTRETMQLRERLAFLHRHDPTWPDTSDDALLATLPEWLGPHLYGLRRMDEVRRLDLGAVLLGRIPWERRAALDELAPSHLQVPSGSRIAVDYSDPDAPVLAVRLQEVFGMTETPRVARGRVPLTMHLLSPARRPVQVTRDLASFWRTGYFEVKKDLKGRYPKHYWPDDPLAATPTHRTRPRP
ncbi:MAG TPA: ATP-dependent helicase C-terminal domain-containing protein, partial [Longimicrobiaceae bacterium]|nr:ATP-dependent helicase C-terminal domain-containing protein [Longimicrobiaceae bacterium]